MENKIKSKRNEKGLSLNDVAIGVGISRQRVFQIESGEKTSNETRAKIMYFLEKADKKNTYLKDLRIEKGMGLVDAAKQIGIAYETLSRFESEKQSIGIKSIVKIAEFYNISTTELARAVL